MARGEHIFFRCAGYSHHGIDVGDDQVIHFDFHPWRVVSQLLRREKPSIRQVSKAQFSQGRELVIRPYTTCDSPDAVVERAKSKLGQSGYCLVRNNCEHFAVWCMTGQAVSTQVDDLVDATRPVGQIAPAAAMLMRTARRMPTQLRGLAYGTAFTLTAGAFTVQYAKNRIRRNQRQES